MKLVGFVVCGEGEGGLEDLIALGVWFSFVVDGGVY